jgi:hypothetical protein
VAGRLLLDVQGSVGTEIDTRLTEVAFEGRFLVGMSEDHPFGAGFHALQTARALVGVDVVRTLLVLYDALDRADLSAFTALGASTHLENPGIREMRDDGQTRLLGIVLLEMEEGTRQLAQPAPRALGTIGH